MPFTHSAEQQSDAAEHEVPSSLQVVPPTVPPSSPALPSTQVLLDGSHVYEPQQPSEVVQSPPTPAQAGWHVPLAQLPEQQSPLLLQQSSSYWQSGSVGVQAPASLLLPESVEPPLPLPLPLPASLGPPLLLPLPLPLLLPLPLPVPPSLAPPPVVPHLPAVHESEQQLPYAEHELPAGSHMVVPQTPFLQSLLQQSVLTLHIWPSGLQVGVGGLHVPELHELLQHSLFFVQVVPSAEHEDDWQVPDTQSLLQQSVLAMQVPPIPAHMGWAHVPPVHVPLQQSLAP